LYDVERQFKETHQDYKTDDDDIFIPYRSFKENVAEALKEAMNSEQSPWDSE
jgi:protein required for attachment to host cells